MCATAATAPEKISATPSRAPFTERGALRLFVRRESFFRNFFSCLAAIASSGPARSSGQARYFVRSRAFPVAYRGRSASLSLLLHGAAVALLVYVTPLLPAAHPTEQSQRPERIYYYYRIPLQHVVQTPAPVSTAPRRLQDSSPPKPPSPPKLQDPPARSLASLISRPARPDNSRQTIYQSASPPDLIIRTEQKLTNVIILRQNQPSLAAPLLQSYSRPAAIEQQASTPEAPVVAETNAPTAVGVIAQIADNNPHLAIPVAGGGVPTRSNASVSEGPPSQAPDVVVVGVDPANAASQLSLPNGNRWGQFSIAAPAEPVTSSHGTAVGSGTSANGKSSSTGNGGHEVSATAGTPGPVDIAGRSGGTGILAPALAVSLVFPVIQPAITVRRNSMVISSGPIGGGGLNVYGALNCGKIYSIFLPMPGKSWSLQYCDRQATNALPNPRSAVVRLANPLLPPDVDLQHRYDFKRTAVQGPNANHPIILKGVIGTDGTVQQLVVYRGVSPILDEAARIAFGRWRFKPAMRDGKPVPVEILVGIPPSSGEDYINR